MYILEWFSCLLNNWVLKQYKDFTFNSLSHNIQFQFMKFYKTLKCSLSDFMRGFRRGPTVG